MSTERETGVYKYCDEHGLDILRNLEIKFTPPNQFNDPFEFTPHVINSNPRRTVNRTLKNKAEIKEMYEEDKAAGIPTGNFRQYRQRFAGMLPEVRRRMIEQSGQTSDAVQSRYLDEVSSVFGVLCLSSRRDSILMWGHYCDKHRGLVIGFDGQHDHFSVKGGLRFVNYIRERIAYDMSWKNGSQELDDYFQRIVISKNDAWEYEKELRHIHELAKLKQKPLGDGKLGHFGSFSAAAIKSVTLGAKCTKPFEESVRALLQDKRLAHVKLDRAVLHPSEFALKFE